MRVLRLAMALVVLVFAGAGASAAAGTSFTLAPGESVIVSFTIDHTSVGAGEFFANNVVYSTGGTLKLLITGKKEVVVNPDIPLPKPQVKPNA